MCRKQLYKLQLVTTCNIHSVAVQGHICNMAFLVPNGLCSGGKKMYSSHLFFYGGLVEFISEGHVALYIWVLISVICSRRLLNLEMDMITETATKNHFLLLRKKHFLASTSWLLQRYAWILCSVRSRHVLNLLNPYATQVQVIFFRGIVFKTTMSHWRLIAKK